MMESIYEEMFELTMTVQALIKRGWVFVEVECAERRLGIGPRLKIKRGEEVKTIYDPSELIYLLDKDNENY